MSQGVRPGGLLRYRGKLSDLVVLDRDDSSVPDVQIKPIRSVLTVVDGNVVHNALS